MAKPEDDSEPFLSRWARRKRDARREGDTPVQKARQPQAEAIEVEGGQVAAHDERGGEGEEAEAFDLGKLPKIEELTGQTDFSVFLDRRVPAALRNAALSRMWSLDPTIRDFIEVAENQWNWNVPGGTPFYELIEPGTDLGISIADATSAIARTLSDGQSEAVAAVTDEVIAVADVEDQKVAPEGKDPAAVQHAGVIAIPAAQGAASTESTAIKHQLNEPPLHVAQQQEAEGARRRHGGVLPA